MTLEKLIALGFDLSEREHKRIRVRCSQCAALFLNGIPCHESGCVNEMHECRGCNAIVPRNVKYCSDCQ